MKRREFMAKSVLGAVGLSKLGQALPELSPRYAGAPRLDVMPVDADSISSGWALDAPSNEKMNLDYVTYLPGVEYFLLGNGDVQAMVQFCRDHKRAGDSSLFGLTLIDPERLSQKWTTFLYRASTGFAGTRMLVGIDGVFHTVYDDNFVSIKWEHRDGVPIVRMEWAAGKCRVVEEFFVPVKGAILFRRGNVRNEDSSSHRLITGITLRPNTALFDSIDPDTKRAIVSADGFTKVQVTSLEKNSKVVGRYDIRVDCGTVEPSQEATSLYAYRIGHSDTKLNNRDFISLWPATSAYWQGKNTVSTGDQDIDHIWEVARVGMRANVAKSGKRDGGMWEYAMEWAGDDIMALKAALMAGFYDEARDLLNRILNKLVTDDGRTVESSQVFDFQFTEINQNGMILYGIWKYVAWTGDYATVKEHWHQVKALAELPLRPFFWDKQSGLLSNSREFWERSSAFGVKPGFELAYQFWVSIGLEKISDIALKLGQTAEADRWSSAAKSIKNALLNNPRYRLVENGHLIKRRTLDGEWQRTFIPPNRASMPAGTPIAVEPEPLTEPDASEVFPIIFSMIDPKSDLSLKTLDWVETLWNQRWTIGGYERYNTSSEPEPPGPWPIASLLIAEANWEAGNFERALRVVRWLNEINGGNSGGWFEYYPEGHPSVGVIAWAWMECVRLVVYHVLGVRPQLDRLVIGPRLAPHMKNVKATIRVRDTVLDLAIRSGVDRSRARANSRQVDMRGGVLTLPYSNKKSLKIEIDLQREG